MALAMTPQYVSKSKLNLSHQLSQHQQHTQHQHQQQLNFASQQSFPFPDSLSIQSMMLGHGHGVAHDQRMTPHTISQINTPEIRLPNCNSVSLSPAVKIFDQSTGSAGSAIDTSFHRGVMSAVNSTPKIKRSVEDINMGPTTSTVGPLRIEKQ